MSDPKTTKRPRVAITAEHPPTFGARFAVRDRMNHTEPGEMAIVVRPPIPDAIHNPGKPFA